MLRLRGAAGAGSTWVGSLPADHSVRIARHVDVAGVDQMPTCCSFGCGAASLRVLAVLVEGPALNGQDLLLLLLLVIRVHRRRGALLICRAATALAVAHLQDVALAATHGEAVLDDLRALRGAAPPVLLR